MSQRTQRIKRTRRYLFLIFFVASLVLVGSMVNGKYGSVVEIVAFTVVGATIVTVLLSLLSIPFVLIGVRVWNKYFPKSRQIRGGKLRTLTKSLVLRTSGGTKSAGLAPSSCS
jgi:hypothetical protein